MSTASAADRAATKRAAPHRLTGDPELDGMAWLATHLVDDCPACWVSTARCPRCGADFSASFDRTRLPLAVRRDHGWVDADDDTAPMRTVVVYDCTGAPTAALSAAAREAHR